MKHSDKENFLQQVAPFVKQSAYPGIFQDLFLYAKHITGCQDAQSMIETFQSNPKLYKKFQRYVENQELEFYRRQSEVVRVEPKPGAGWEKESLKVFLSGLGLILCLGVIVYLSDHIPGESVGLLSAIITIFGGCLRDFYRYQKLPGSEQSLAQSRNKSRKATV